MNQTYNIKCGQKKHTHTQKLYNTNTLMVAEFVGYKIQNAIYCVHNAHEKSTTHYICFMVRKYAVMPLKCLKYV